MPLDDLDALLADFDAVLAPLEPAALDARPADGGWTARETMAHLTITARLYDASLQGVLARHPEGRPATDGPRRPTLFARLLLRWLPDLAKRFRAPRRFDPRRSDEHVEVADLRAAYVGLRDTAASLQRLHLEDVVFGTPVSPLLRMRTRDAVAVQIAHARRHRSQILRAAGVEESA